MKVSGFTFLRNEDLLRGIGDPKVRILPTTWNERMKGNGAVKGFVYGQQKSIALFNCTGDWAFYLEGDEVVHEDDLPVIRAAMEKHLEDDRVECLFFHYLHFYGNANTLACSPGWYRTAPRIIRNTIPCWAPKGLFTRRLSRSGCPNPAVSSRPIRRTGSRPGRKNTGG